MTRTMRIISVLVAVGYFALALAYNVSNPLFEAPDERLHYEFVRQLQSEKVLPAVDLDGPPTEYHQPLLYYVITAILTAPLQFPNIEPYTQPNPFWGYNIGEVGSDNKNQYLHNPNLSRFDVPVIPIYLMRLVSTMLGLLSLCLTFLLARHFLPDSGSLAVAALVAFIPNFLLTSASITNDALAITVSAGTCWYLVRLLHSTRQPSIRQWGVLGLLLAAALLTKLNIWPLLLIAALTVLLLSVQYKSFKMFLTAGCVLLVTVGLLAGWWLLRNQLLYSDPTALAANAATWGTRGALGFNQTLVELLNMRTTFWANFGYGNVPLPNSIYLIGDVILIGSIFGLGLAWCKHPHWADLAAKRTSAIILTTYLALIFIGLILSMPNQIAVTGRHFYPALPIIALGIFLGWRTMIPRDLIIAIALPSLLALTALIALPTVLITAYRSTPSSTLPDDATLLGWQAGDVATLLGYTATPSVSPGGSAEVTLFWRAENPTDTNYVGFTHLYNMQGEQIGKRDSYPDTGKYPTSFWQPNQIVADRIQVPIAEDAEGPFLMPLEVGLYDLQTGERLLISDPAGNTVGFPVIGSIKLEQQQASVGFTEWAGYGFGDLAILTSSNISDRQISPGNMLTVTLYWYVTGRASQSYSVFVHLVDEAGNLVAQSDSVPRAGYYPTDAWAEGERFADVHIITLPQDVPPGDYQLHVGFYEPETFQRVLTDTGTGFITLPPNIEVSP